MPSQKQEKYDVAIVGVGVGANYGSVLTYFSLYKTIESLGKKVLMVSKIGAKANDPEMMDTHAVRFAHEHYNLSKLYNQTTVKALNDIADTFVIGSDQVWNYGVAQHFGKAFYLDFVRDDKRRISYAASFGHGKDFASEEERQHIRPLMQRFNAISVREDSGVTLARDFYHVPAKQVAEPIFLTSTEGYLDLAAKSKRDISKPYLLAYILDPTPEKKAAIEHIASKLGLGIRIILDGFPHLFKENVQKMAMDDAIEANVETYDFLKLYANSSYVVTDSFHGTAFALKFEKPFASIGNKRRGMVRFDSMFRLIGHRDRFTLDPAKIVKEDARFLAPLDYAKISRALNEHVVESKAWLKAALEKPVNETVGEIEPAMGAKLIEATSAVGKVVDFFKHQINRQRINLERPSFVANNDVWRFEPLARASRITVSAPDAAVRGNLVWCDLSTPLIDKAAYEMVIDWTLRTESKSVNVHIRNPQTGKFIVVGKIPVGVKRNAPRTDIIRFIVPGSNFSQIMFGAVHFSGTNAGADISSLTLQTIQPQDAKLEEKPVPMAQSSHVLPDLPQSKLAKNKKLEPKLPLAVPEDTPNREQIILNVLSNPKVQMWKKRLSAEMPFLTFYVGRELKEYMNNKVGGPADLLAFPKNIDEVKGLIEFSRRNDIAYTVLGRGSNVIVRDGGIRGIVILTTEMKYFKIDGTTFTTGAGSSLIEAAYYLLENDRSGLEWAAGIPGTIGGAVYMNAGTYTSDIRSSVKSVKVIDDTGRIFVLDKEDIEWGVRYTTFQTRKNWVILEATFKVSSGKNIQMASKMLGTVQSRENNMPLESPNHGSTFKWYRAPRLIQQAGLVGTRIGGVKISEKQPGFFINVKQARASDYEALINYTIAKVYQFSGFMLEPEVEIIGELPHRYKRYTKEYIGKKLD